MASETGMVLDVFCALAITVGRGSANCSASRASISAWLVVPAVPEDLPDALIEDFEAARTAAVEKTTTLLNIIREKTRAIILFHAERKMQEQEH